MLWCHHWTHYLFQHIFRKAKQWDVEVTVVSEMRFDIPQMYKFHKKKSKDIAVDFLRFGVPDRSV